MSTGGEPASTAPVPQDIRRQAVRSLGWAAVESWASQGIGLLVFLILARLLTPDAFGLVAMAAVYIAFVNVFLDQGFADAVIQRRELEAEHLDSAFWTALGIGAVLSLASLAMAGTVARFFGHPELTGIVRALSLVFVVSGLGSVPAALLTRDLSFRSLAIRSVAGLTAGGIAGISLAFLGFGVYSLVVQTLVQATVGAAVLWAGTSWRPRFRFSPQHFGEMFAFGRNVLGLNVLNFFNRHADDLLIGYFLGPVALGYYTVGYRVLRTLTNVFTRVTSRVTYPLFARLQADPERVRAGFYKSTLYTAVIAFPTFVGMAVLAPDIVIHVFGPRWAPSIPVMQVLAFVGIWHSVSYSNRNVLVALGKPSWQLRLSAIGTVVNVVSFAVAVRWGIVAVAAAYVLRAYLLAPLSLVVIRRLIGIRLRTYGAQLARPALASAFMAGVLLLSREHVSLGLGERVDLALQILFGFVSYAAALGWIGRGLLQELRAFVIPRTPSPVAAGPRP